MDRTSQEPDSRSLNVCVIHDLGVVKNIIRDYLLADHPDATVFLAVPCPDLRDHLRDMAYDVIFSGIEMEAIDISDILSALAGSEVNATTPLVVMTATDTPETRERLAGGGLRHILPLPCTSTTFRRLLYRIFNPDSNRVHRLYYIPNSVALMRYPVGPDGTPGQEWTGDIVTVGMDGVTCELVCDQPSNLRGVTEVRLRFPADYGRASTIEVSGVVFGIKRLERMENVSTPTVRVSWRLSWRGFELRAATKRSLLLPLGTAVFDGAAAAELASLTELNGLLAEENAAIRSDRDVLVMENEDVIRKIAQLRRRVELLESAGGTEAARLVSLSALINEQREAAREPGKLALFKRLIEDNVKLRTES